MVTQKKKFAMKVFESKLIKDSTPFFHRELDAYSNLKHNNITQLIKPVVYDRKISSTGQLMFIHALILEHVFTKDLYELLKKTGPFTEDISRMVFRQIVEAVGHIHQTGYAHLDLKLDNLFIAKTFAVKIANFDHSMSTTNTGKVESGSKAYLAPEAKTGSQQNYDRQKVDIFALGVILFTLSLGVPPFQEASKSDYWYGKILQKKNDDFWEYWERHKITISDPLKKLLESLMAPEPKDRPSTSEMLNCEWMKIGKKITSMERSVTETLQVIKIKV